MSDAIKQDIKDYIMGEFLPGESPDELSDSTPLISGGILDSIATLKLVMYLEEKYSVNFEPHEVDKENLDSLDLVARLLRSKLPAGAA
jgi:acyl carrier protein